MSQTFRRSPPPCLAPPAPKIGDPAPKVPTPKEPPVKVSPTPKVTPEQVPVVATFSPQAAGSQLSGWSPAISSDGNARVNIDPRFTMSTQNVMASILEGDDGGLGSSNAPPTAANIPSMNSNPVIPPNQMFQYNGGAFVPQWNSSNAYGIFTPENPGRAWRSDYPNHDMPAIDYTNTSFDHPHVASPALGIKMDPNEYLIHDTPRSNVPSNVSVKDLIEGHVKAEVERRLESLGASSFDRPGRKKSFDMEDFVKAMRDFGSSQFETGKRGQGGGRDFDKSDRGKLLLDPPAFDGGDAKYLKWADDIRDWRLTTSVPLEKQGGVLKPRLGGKVFRQVRLMKQSDVFDNRNALQNILDELHVTYMKTRVEQAIARFNALISAFRGPREPWIEFSQSFHERRNHFENVSDDINFARVVLRALPMRQLPLNPNQADITCDKFPGDLKSLATDFVESNVRNLFTRNAVISRVQSKSVVQSHGMPSSGSRGIYAAENEQEVIVDEAGVMWIDVTAEDGEHVWLEGEQDEVTGCYMFRPGGKVNRKRPGGAARPKKLLKKKNKKKGESYQAGGDSEDDSSGEDEPKPADGAPAPTVQGANAVGAKRSPPSKDMKCFGCGKPGHSMSQCKSTPEHKRKEIWDKKQKEWQQKMQEKKRQFANQAGVPIDDDALPLWDNEGGYSADGQPVFEDVPEDGVAMIGLCCDSDAPSAPHMYLLSGDDGSVPDLFTEPVFIAWSDEETDSFSIPDLIPNYVSDIDPINSPVTYPEFCPRNVSLVDLNTLLVENIDEISQFRDFDGDSNSANDFEPFSGEASESEFGCPVQETEASITSHVCVGPCTQGHGVSVGDKFPHEVIVCPSTCDVFHNVSSNNSPATAEFLQLDIDDDDLKFASARVILTIEHKLIPSRVKCPNLIDFSKSHSFPPTFLTVPSAFRSFETDFRGAGETIERSVG